jgi:hypothetical protein
MVAYWRAQRLTAGVQALRAELTGADAQQYPEDADPLPLADPSSLVRVWDLIGPAAAATEALLTMQAHLTLTDDPKAMVAQLDMATGLLVRLGHQARRLRFDIGLE